MRWRDGSYHKVNANNLCLIVFKIAEYLVWEIEVCLEDSMRCRNLLR